MTNPLKILLAVVLLGAFSWAQTTHVMQRENNETVTGHKRFAPGITVGPVNFADLAGMTSTNLVYCADCQQTNPCLAGGGGAMATSVNGVWQCAAGSGGGNIDTGANPSQNPVWVPGTSRWQPQNKAVYDVRDWGFVCDGTTYNTSAAVTLVAAIAGKPAKVHGTSPSAPCGMGDFLWPSNIELDFTSGWQLKTLTDSTTTPGTATLNATAGATGHCESNATTSTCAMSLTATANDTYVIACGRGFTGGALSLTSNVASDIILPLPGSDPGFVSITQGWYIPDVVAGAHTITATSGANYVGACTAVPVSGLGPTPVVDTGSTTCPNASANSPYACTANLTAGDFVVFWGMQNNTAETCGATGGGVTLLSGAAGCSTNTGSNMAVAYLASAVGGSFTPSIAFAPSPAGHFWSAETIGLRPGTATNVIMGKVDCASGCFSNATVPNAGVSFVGNRLPLRVKPEWWGGGSGAAAATNTGALQAAISAAFPLNNQQYNKVLDLSGGIYSINDELKWYGTRGNQAARAQVDCGSGGGITQTANNKRIMDGQGMAYMTFSNCQWLASATSSGPLLDIDWTNGVAPTGTLKPQFLDFYTNTFAGNGLYDTGVLIAKSGGAAQGSNINFFDPAFQSFTGACLQIGGDNTGRNAGRFAATNAIQIGLWGGDIQGCSLYGVANYAGQNLTIYNTTFENSTQGFNQQTGFDIYTQNCIGGGISVDVKNVRSESRRLIAGCNLHVSDSFTINQASYPTPGSGFPVGTIFMGSSLSDGKYYRVTVDASPLSGFGTPSVLAHGTSGSPTTLVDAAYLTAGALTPFTGPFCTANEVMTQAVTGSTANVIAAPVTGNMVTSQPTGAPDNSHIWTGGTSGCQFTPTAVPVAEANWTVNAFANFQASTLGGTNAGCKGIISSNTANTLTVASWTTPYAGIVCASPAFASTFVVEPNWGTQFTSGGVTWVDQNENGIEGQSGTGLSGSTLENVSVPGNRIAIADANSVILRNVKTTRNDWANLVGGNPYETGSVIANRFDVINLLTISNSGTPRYKSWQLPRLTGGRTYFSGAVQDNLGSRALVWECGDPAGGNPCNDKWIGGAQDYSSGATFGRNILPFCCLFGPSTPIGTDQNATQAIVGMTGGLATGTGTPGDLGLYYSPSSGVSGATPNAAVPAWLVKGGTGHLLANTDNTFDIGAAGATRPRRVYAGTDFVGPVGQTTPAAGSFTSLTNTDNSANSGHAACFKTGGVLGYCSTAVDASGLCTCN